MKATRPVTPTKAPATAPRKDVQLFGRENYRWMLIGLVILVIGFLLMAGGGSDNPNEFLVNEVYSPRRITVAPIVILLGIVVEIYALVRQPKNTTTAD